jgi:hypothetical protein
VVFPAPEGEDKTSISPRRAAAIVKRVNRVWPANPAQKRPKPISSV